MLVDSHCHLDFPDFAAERDAIVIRAREQGVGRLVTISTKVHKFPEIQAITDAYHDVFCSVGTHPHHADKEPDISTADLVKLAQGRKVVAIGEAGLDYFRNNSSVENQERGFRRHIAAARETGLPLVIHAREADDDIARILEEESAKGAFPFVLHCFTGGPDLAKRGVALGGYVSFSGVITFKKNEALRAIAADVPADRILIETDAPFLAPEPYRGKRNEPAYVANTAKALAAARNTDFDTIAAQTTENFFRLFSKVPRAA
jgi:TatD DNase family protein